MAEPRKSALFVDYDSIYRSVKAASKDASERLAQRAATWVAAIESGRLFTARSEEAVRRRVLIRRCYADPHMLGKNRPAFTSAGFEIIDCPPLESRDRGSADIHMVLDTMDALEHPTGYDEFILLSADADLTPVLLRLRAHNRATAIYATQATPAPYRAIPDAVVEEATLLQVLSADDARAVPQPQAIAEAPEERARPALPLAAAGDRGDIEVLARKVHNATAVPLFSPRTFADLFRVLAQEIAENGYHFQSTAENVAGKLAAAGRNVTRRQVVFVVKGLALKGHVFSTTDTSERLAEVFREQVIYLIGNNGLALDSREQALLASWIVGRVPTATAVATAVEIKPEPEAKPVEEKAPKKRAAKAPVQAARPASQKAIAPPPPPAAPPSPAASGNARPAPAPSSVQPSRSIEEIKAAVAARAAAMRSNATVPRAVPPPRPPAQPASQRPAASSPSRPASPPPPARPATVDYSRPMQATRPPPPPARPPVPRQAPSPPPAAPRATPPQRAAASSAEASKQALESSILAAIAQAVDVLVEDDTPPTPPAQDAAPAPSLTSPTPEPVPEPEPEPVSGDAEGGDIGDEIQRIIASYSRARQQGEPR